MMDWVSGAADRLRGRYVLSRNNLIFMETGGWRFSVNTAAAQLFGDKEDAAKNQAIHDQGKAQQRSAEHGTE